MTMLENIKNYLKDRGFEYVEYEPDAESILLFWNEDLKVTDKYIVYNILADGEGMDIGYVTENSNRYFIGSIRWINWNTNLTVDEIFREILEETKQIRKFAIDEERKDYLDEAMKERMLFNDVQSIIEYYRSKNI